jgi:DNA primase
MNESLSPYLEKLPEYLGKYGINLKINTSGKCPIKEHKSYQPFRLGIGRGGDPVWHCFACDIGGSIFDLAAQLHGYPRGTEPGFYDVTVRHLSDSLTLPFPNFKVQKRTVKEQYKIDLYNVTREISNHLSYLPIKEYAEKRGWDAKILKEFNIGGISDYNKLLSYLRTNYSDKVLTDVGFLTKNPNFRSIFFDDRIIFTIHDPVGRPVGFTARAMDYVGGNNRKYINTSNSVIFSKRNILYNIHRARAALNKEDSKVLYMVEGQADVITLASNGIRSAVAISGTSFTDEHVALIKEFNLVVSCLDADDGGTKATRKLYNKYHASIGKDLYLLQLPSGSDPDEFIKKNGIDAFLSLDPILPIEWEILNEYMIREKMLANYWLPRLAVMNSFYHEKVLKTISVKTGMCINSLRDRLNTLILEETQRLISTGLLTGSINLSIERR